MVGGRPGQQQQHTASSSQFANLAASCLPTPAATHLQLKAVLILLAARDNGEDGRGRKRVQAAAAAAAAVARRKGPI
jgi:hypothetical protein